MKYKIFSFVLVFTFSVIFGCSGSNEGTDITEIPACPAISTIDYVGCWDSDCDFLRQNIDDQWRMNRFYLTEDSKLHVLALVYANSDCSGEAKLNPLDQSDPPGLHFTFTDKGIETLPSGIEGHRIVFNFYESSANNNDVLSAVVNNQVCFSSNFVVRGVGPGYAFGTNPGVAQVVDFTNCLDKVVQ